MATNGTGVPSPPTIMLDPASDTGISNSDGLTDLSEVTLTGTAPSGDVVTIYDQYTPAIPGANDSAKNVVAATVTVPDDSNTYSVVVDLPTPYYKGSDYTFTATATDPTTNITSPVSQPAEVHYINYGPVVDLYFLYLYPNAGPTSPYVVTLHIQPFFNPSLLIAKFDTLPNDGTFTVNGKPVVIGQIIDGTDFFTNHLQFTPTPGLLYGSSSYSFSYGDRASPLNVTKTESIYFGDPAYSQSSFLINTVKISPVVSRALDGSLTLTGTAFSSVGIRSVEITAQVDGVATDLGTATVSGDGTFSFKDIIGAGTQAFFAATLTDGAGGTATSADPLFSLTGGVSGNRVEQDRYTPDGSVRTAKDVFKANGSQKADVFAMGQTFASSSFDTFNNHGQPGTTFVFDPGSGRDMVTLFRVNGTDHDTLSFKGSDFGSTLADQLASVLSHSRNTAAGLLITDPTASSPGAGGHDTVLLKGVTKTDLNANQADITFHV